MILYSDYCDLLHTHGLLRGTLTKAIKIWTGCGFAHTFDMLMPQTIFEIGRFDGHSLGLMRFLAPAATIVSVEPQPRPHATAVLEFLDKRAMALGFTPKTIYVNKTSDRAFGDGDVEKHGPYDFALIDGDHSYEGALRDWGNTKGVMAPDGVVAFDNTEMACGRVFSRIDDYETVMPFHVNFRKDPADGGQYGLVFMGKRPDGVC